MALNTLKPTCWHASRHGIRLLQTRSYKLILPYVQSPHRCCMYANSVLVWSCIEEYACVCVCMHYRDSFILHPIDAINVDPAPLVVLCLGALSNQGIFITIPVSISSHVKKNWQSNKVALCQVIRECHFASDQLCETWPASIVQLSSTIKANQSKKGPKRDATAHLHPQLGKEIWSGCQARQPYKAQLPQKEVR